MISVENLYWILFENLLKPVNLDCWYYFPFGTQQNLSRSGEFKPLQPHQDNHVLFHYDQEPLYSCDFGKYDLYHAAFSNKIVRMLANSEHSALKKQICRERQMLDWYFFYHGFAALDWYRDCRFVTLNSKPKKIFSSYSHQGTHLRAYRMAMMARFLHSDILAFGDVSFHVDHSGIQQELQDPKSLLSERDRHLVQHHMMTKHQWPLILDRADINGSDSAHFGHREYKLWQNSFVHVVNETVFYHHKLHLTEKIFKPIVALRPFVLVGAPGNLAYLRSYGFRTFDQWWDESYDDCLDTDERCDRITQVIKTLCEMSQQDRDCMHHDMRSVLDFNKRHFFGDFRKIIVDELVDNFDTCIRTWNNGRLDDRGCVLHPDLASVKRLLLV